MTTIVCCVLRKRQQDAPLRAVIRLLTGQDVKIGRSQTRNRLKIRQSHEGLHRTQAIDAGPTVAEAVSPILERLPEEPGLLLHLCRCLSRLDAVSPTVILLNEMDRTPSQSNGNGAFPHPAFRRCRMNFRCVSAETACRRNASASGRRYACRSEVRRWQRGRAR